MRIICTVIFCVLLWPSISFGQSKEAQAQKYFEDGAALYYSGDYGGAISKFKLGHSLVPNALFPFNMSLCHQKLDKFKEALDSAVEAKTIGGLGESEIPNDARIVALRRIVHLTQIDWPQPEVEEPPGEAIATSRWGALGWVGVGTLAVGAGTLIFAGITEVELQDTFERYQAAADSTDIEEFNRLKDEVESLQTRGKVLLFTGGGLALLGAVLIIADVATVERRPVVSIMPTRDGLDASIRFHF